MATGEFLATAPNCSFLTTRYSIYDEVKGSKWNRSGGYETNMISVSENGLETPKLQKMHVFDSEQGIPLKRQTHISGPND